MHIHRENTSSIKYTYVKEKILKHGKNLKGILSYLQNEGPQQELVVTWVWMLGNLKTESGAKALCQASTPAGTTSTAAVEFSCCNQTMETSQERFWAPHNHDHAVPCYRPRLKCFLVKIAPCLESKALVKETCFHSFSEKTAATCAPTRFLQADFGTETVSRFCGSGT